MGDRTDRASSMVVDLVRRCHFPPPATPYRCGVSGGADSMALLILATTAGLRVTAVHVDHGLRPGSSVEAEVVASAAERFGASFESHRIELEDGPNLEARARHARRAVLGATAATAHTADDQAETVLINLLRGTGLDGLCGMVADWRHPLLALRRSETTALCAEVGVKTVVDPMNEDPRFVRVRVRHELLPLASEIAGRDLVPLLVRQAEALADDAAILEAVADLVDPEDGRALASAPTPVARRAVRQWLTEPGQYPPSRAAVERVLEVARQVRVATELPGGRRVARTDGRLRIAEPGRSGTVAP